MILKERDTDEGLLVAVCDNDVLGETFEDDDLSLTVTEEFYGGEQVGEEEVIESLAQADVANLVGIHVVSLAIEHGFVEEGNVLDVGTTRHAQFLQL